MRGSEFEFEGVNFLYYDFNKTSINRGGSYIDSPKWLKDKKSTINPKNNDDKCFQYAVTLALNLGSSVTLSKEDNKDFIDQQNKGFQRSIYWNEYKTEEINENADAKLFKYINLDPSF